MDRHDRFLVICLAAILFSASILFYALYDGHKRLFKQCLEDGHKEYVCYSILNGR